MNNLEQLKTHCTELLKKYPKLREDINMLYWYCVSEVEAGESLQNEIDLCLRDLDQLIESYEENNNS